MWEWIALLALPLFWVAVDITGALRARKYHDSQPAEGSSDNFSVLVPIYGDMRYLTNKDYLATYANKVVLCTTSGESDEFYQEFDAVARQYGFQSYRSPYVPVTQSKGRRRTGGVIRDRVIRDVLFSDVKLGRYTICMDADTTTPDRLEKLAGALEASEADFASIELVPQEQGNFLVQLQRHEYRQSMRMRFLLPWMLSGACHIGKTRVFQQIMGRHSLFFQGNDVEAGLLGDQLGYEAVHIPFKVDTEVPHKLKPWWRQRIAWSGGEFRLFITNIRYIIKHPFLWVYGGLITIMTIGLRWSSVVQPTWILLVVAALYYLYTLWIHWSHRNKWLLLMPIYSLFNSLIVVPIGLVWYFVMAIPEKNFGVINPKREVNVSA